MKTPESYPLLIDEIFANLEEASRIEIDLDATLLNNHGQQINSAIVKSINGQYSAQRYLHYMKDLKAGILDNLKETLQQIDPADTEAFFEQVQRRMRQILNSVSIITRPGMESALIKDVGWTTNQVHFRCNGAESEYYLAHCRALRQTRRHAWIYYIIMKKLDDRINCLAAASFILSMPNLTPPHKESRPKFKISLTVAHLGALLRVICDRNIIEKPNVAELCRRIAPFFYTDRQQNISPKSLRNSYDDPNIEILTQILSELKLWERYIEKFIERKKG